MMPIAYLPTWAAVLVTVLLLAVLAVHLRHVVALEGRHRMWHGVHVLMAAGMVVMVAPTQVPLLPAPAGAAGYGVAAAILLGLVVTVPVPPQRIGALWLVSVLDLAAMAYMFALPALGIAWVTVLLALWFVVQAVGWLTAGLLAALDDGGLGTPLPPAAAARRSVAAPSRPATTHTTSSRVVLRLSLGFMAAVMAAMLLAMQFPPPGMAMTSPT